MLDFVPRRPPPLDIIDPRLEPYRERGGVALDRAGRRGLVFVETQTWWTATGHLWWRRFGEPRELPLVWVLLPDGQVHDFLLPADDVATLTADWAVGRLGTFNGVQLSVDWLDELESRRVRDEIGVPERKVTGRVRRCQSPSADGVSVAEGPAPAT
jgi:hypothetical protein